MKKDHNLVLALYPNTRGLGYACVESPKDIIDYGIVTVRPICNGRILKRAKKFIEYYEPTLILIQDYESKYSRHGKRVSGLIDTIVAYAKEKRVPIKQYSREQIRNVLEQFGAKTKYEIATKIIKWLPELKHRTPKVRKLWMSEDYNMGIFDALSLAITHFYLME